jgi:fatty acid desaturase
MKRSDLQGWFQAVGHLTLFAGTGILSYLFWSRQMWFRFAAVLFTHGTIGSFFTGVAPHELGHGTVFRTKWLNKLFLYLYSLLSWWDPFDYAMSHTYHHRYTLHPEGDREVLLPLKPSGRAHLPVADVHRQSFHSTRKDLRQGRTHSNDHHYHQGGPWCESLDRDTES